MTLTISKNSNHNYLAKVVRLHNLRKHSNADRLQVMTVDGNNVITSLTAQDGMLYVYFPLESTINKDYLSYSNSFTDPLLNQNQEVKGYFSKTGRVRATNLRGEKSEGYMVPVSDISNWLKDKYDLLFYFTEEMIDQEFDTVCGIKLCEKYINYEQINKLKKENKDKNKSKLKRFNRLIEDQFHFHIDTPQLKKCIENINWGDTIEISKKLHGTSVILSKVKCNKKLNFFERILKYFGVNIVDTQYDLLYSSRKVVKNGFLDAKDNPNKHYYSSDVWGDCAKKYGDFLKDGITLYGEIVGFTKDGAYIQKDYDYGCNPREFELYVYRGTITTPKGDVYEMSVPQLKKYCDTYGIKTVPQIFYGTPEEYMFGLNVIWPGYTAETKPSVEFLDALVKEFLEKDCDMCINKVPDEGICLRVDKPFDIEVYKLKSFRFFERETKLLDQGEVDMETIESEEVSAA